MHRKNDGRRIRPEDFLVKVRKEGGCGTKNMTIYRNEWKHEISRSDLITIRQRMRAVAKPDEHAGPKGSYQVRSLYFDTPSDRALREKLTESVCGRNSASGITIMTPPSSAWRRRANGTAWGARSQHPLRRRRPEPSRRADGTGCLPAAGIWSWSCTAR